MARIKYYYDTESCRYERIKVSTWDIILNALGILALVAMFSIGIFFIYIEYVESPKEAMLRKANEELEFHNDLQGKEIAQMQEILATLQERDDNVYRTIMDAEPIPDAVRNAGFGGVNRYKDLMDQGLEQEELIIGNYQKLDKLKKQMYIQTKSYDEIMDLAARKEERFASLPAIQPVNNKELKRLSSGFGYRTDPIYKVRRMHAGVDFSCPKGTPIYATGDGEVFFTKSSYSGFGNYVKIDHGFGYITLYGHMDSYIVKKGQKVKRGEVIGYVGNSGKSTAPHLHYEVHKNGKKINPVHFFTKDLNPEEYDEILRLSSIENQALGSF
ncbi:MAG: M23 family metallopeptidase [bacterium]|nr:M23 family metallopeptidase [bacterium]